MDPLLPETSTTITLVSCYIGSQSDPFPLCLDKMLTGCGDRLQHQIHLKNLPSIKSGSVSQWAHKSEHCHKNSPSIKVWYLSPPELVISHMLAYKLLADGLPQNQNLIFCYCLDTLCTDLKLSYIKWSF